MAGRAFLRQCELRQVRRVWRDATLSRLRGGSPSLLVTCERRVERKKRRASSRHLRGFPALGKTPMAGCAGTHGHRLAFRKPAGAAVPEKASAKSDCCSLHSCDASHVCLRASHVGARTERVADYADKRRCRLEGACNLTRFREKSREYICCSRDAWVKKKGWRSLSAVFYVAFSEFCL